MRWERATGTLQPYPYLEASGIVTAFAEDRAGNTWIDFSEGKLARYRDGHFQLSGSIRALYLDSQGRLWIAGRSGLAHLVHRRRPSPALSPSPPHKVFQTIISHASPKTGGSGSSSSSGRRPNGI